MYKKNKQLNKRTQKKQRAKYYFLNAFLNELTIFNCVQFLREREKRM